MNKIAKEHLPAILKDKAFWDKKSGKVDVKLVNETLQTMHEVIFYDELYYPHIVRFMKKAIGMKIFKKKELEEFEVGYNVSFKIFLPDDGYMMQVLNDVWQDALAHQWYNDPEWMWEELAEKEIMSVGIVSPYQVQMVLF